MSYHGKLQVLKNGTADAEIQLWAYQQIETIEYLYKRHDEQQAEIAELKHMNKNWQISEGMALAEIEALKDKLMLAKQSLEIIEGYIK